MFEKKAILNKIDKNDSREKAVDILKGYAIIGVVLHHLSVLKADIFSPSYYRIVDSIFFCVVYTFLFLSGYLLKRQKKDGSKKTYVIKKTKGLILPYLWFGSLYILLYYVFSQFHAVLPQFSVRDSFIALLTVDNYNTIGGQLYYLVLFYIISLLYLFLPRSVKLNTIQIINFLVLFVFILFLRINGKLTHAAFEISTIIPGCFAFYMGYVYGKTAEQKKKWYAILAVMLLLSVPVDIIKNKLELARLAGPLLLFSILNKLQLKSVVWDVIAKIGRSTATIFIYHKPILIRAFVFIFLTIRLPLPVVFIFSSVCILILCMFLRYFAIRYRVSRWIIFT